MEARYRADIDDKLNVPIMLIRSLMQAGNPENVTITFVTREGQQISGLETIDPIDGDADRTLSRGHARISQARLPRYRHSFRGRKSRNRGAAHQRRSTVSLP